VPCKAGATPITPSIGDAENDIGAMRLVEFAGESRIVTVFVALSTSKNLVLFDKK
jgi:hypothetical protein